MSCQPLASTSDIKLYPEPKQPQPKTSNIKGSRMEAVDKINVGDNVLMGGGDDGRPYVEIKIYTDTDMGPSVLTLTNLVATTRGLVSWDQDTSILLNLEMHRTQAQAGEQSMPVQEKSEVRDEDLNQELRSCDAPLPTVSQQQEELQSQ